jgi:hypothetical protein
MTQVEDIVRARFEALPFYKTRCEKHIAGGNVAIGDFMLNYDTLVQTWDLSRPVGRSIFARGDAECYTSRDGQKAASWRVVSIDRVSGDVIFSVEILDGSRVRMASMLWNHVQRGKPQLACGDEGDMDVLLELFSARSAWLDNNYKLDLWDWSPNQAQPGRRPGTTVIVTRHSDVDGAWLVELVDSSTNGIINAFIWIPNGGRNMVAKVHNRPLDMTIVRELLVRQPERF